MRKIAVVGLGYVGLPVAVAFGQKVPTIGFDVNETRIQELKSGNDRNREVTATELKAPMLSFTSDCSVLKGADFYIIAVPTPVDSANVPDLQIVLKASETVAKCLTRGDIVVYESTVYPGATEEDCVPVLEKYSGLKCGVDFKVGYSPERINPGDHEHTFTKIKKVVSAQDADSLKIVSAVYGSVVTAGVYEAASIKVAEAAKVIENTQRDLNIALMNELALVFDHLNIDTSEVLAAAGTKWNFLKFTPGLVGGHCIGVDPYYLTYRAEKAGYIPQVILAGRRINDGVGKFIAQRTIKEMIRAGHPIAGQTVSILGLTFKENIADLRNSKVIDIIRELESFGVNVQVNDPVAYPNEAKHEYGVDLVEWNDLKPAAAVILAVAHEEYKKLDTSILKKMMGKSPVLIDIKSIFNSRVMNEAGIKTWRL